MSVDSRSSDVRAEQSSRRTWQTTAGLVQSAVPPSGESEQTKRAAPVARQSDAHHAMVGKVHPSAVIASVLFRRLLTLDSLESLACSPIYSGGKYWNQSRIIPGPGPDSRQVVGCSSRGSVKSRRLPAAELGKNEKSKSQKQT